MLRAALQNVLGNYEDCQSALNKMDLREQLKLMGVAESAHSTAGSAPKPTPLTGHPPATGRQSVAAAAGVVSSLPPTPHTTRKEKVRKAHKEGSKKPADAVNASSSAQDLSSNKRKRIVIRGPNLTSGKDGSKSCPEPPKERHVETITNTVPTLPLFAESSKPSFLVPETSPAPVLSHNVSVDKLQATELVPNSGVRTKKEKKVRKKKSSPPRMKHISHLTVQPANDPSPSSPLHNPPSDQIRQRPEALSLPGRGSVPVSVIPSESSVGAGHQSDAPDTGDVEHMLDELLHPPSLSLVTPIPTPNTFTPFVFPNLSSTSQVSECQWTNEFL